MDKRYIHKTSKFALVISLLFISTITYAQNTVSIGTTELKSDAVLWLNGTGSQGLLLPVADKDNFTPTDEGMMIYDAGDNMVYFWTGAAWQAVAGGSGGGADNWGTQVANTNAPLTGDGTSASPITLVDGNSADQILVWDGSVWGLQPLPSGSGTDDQNLVVTGDVLSIEGGTGTVDLSTYIDDADADPANELQDLSLAGTTLNIAGGTGVDLAPIIPPGGTDNQNLVITGDILSIEDGTGSVDLSTYVDDADADTGNELIDGVSLSGTIVNISENGSVTGSIDLAPILPPGGTDDQNLVITGDVLSIEDGTGSVDLSTYVDDADADTGNELISDVSLSGNIINISENGSVTGSVDLTPIVGGGSQDIAAVLSVGNNAGGTTITGLPVPSGGTDAATKDYVDGSVSAIPIGTDSQDLSISGNNLSLTGDPTPGAIDLSGYLDNTDAQSLSLSGATGTATTGETFNIDIAGGTGVTITEGTNIEIQRSGTDLIIGSSASASGEANTASNVGGAGVGAFKQKAGSDLEFKNINAGSNLITVSDDTGNDEIDIDVNQANILIANSQVTGLGTLSAQDANTVNITGGGIDGVALSNTTIDNTVSGDGSSLTNVNAAQIQGTNVAGTLTPNSDDVLKWDGTQWTASPDITTGTPTTFGGAGVPGIVPDPVTETGRFLSDDGTWTTPPGGGDLLSTNNLGDVADVSTSRTNLGLGTIATQDASAVNITGGTIDGIAITNSTIDATVTGDGSGLTGVTSTVTSDGTTITGDGSGGSPLTVLAIGSAEITDGTVSSADIANGTILNADIAPAAGIDVSKISGLVDNDATNEIQNLSEVLTEGNSAGNVAIINLTDPTNPQDAATKSYIDNLAATNNITGSFATGFTIANDAVTGSNIADGTVGTTDLVSTGNDLVLTTDAGGIVQWEPKSGFGGAATLDALTDVTLSTAPPPQVGEFLKYDGSEWINESSIFPVNETVTASGTLFNLSQDDATGTTPSMSISNNSNLSTGFVLRAEALGNNVAGYFVNNNNGSTSQALYAHSTGTGPGILALGLGANGAAATFETPNAGNTDAVVTIEHQGTGNSLDILSGNIEMNGNAITGLVDPTNPQDAATRQFVLDNAGSGTLQSSYDGGQTINLGSGDIFIDGDGNTDRFLVDNAVVYINNNTEIGPRLTLGAEFNATQWTVGAADQPGNAPFIISNSGDFSDPLFVILGDGSGAALDGNVGIGAPGDSKLQVGTGNIQIDREYSLLAIDPSDVFTYQTKDVPQYGTGWYDDAETPGLAQNWHSSFAGIKMFTSGLRRFSISQNGNVSIGSTSPATNAALDIQSTTRGLLIPRLTTAQRDAIVGPEIGLMIYNTSTSSFNFYNGGSWTTIGGGSSLWTDASPDINYTAGNVGIGTTTPSTRLEVASAIEISGEGSTSTLSFDHANSTSTRQGVVQFNRARGDQTTKLAVQSGDALGTMNSRGYDGAGYGFAADISFEVDGTVGANDIPGAITFGTNPAGAPSLTERMRITSDGVVGIGTPAPEHQLHIQDNVTASNTEGVFIDIQNTFGSSTSNAMTGIRFKDSNQAAGQSFKGGILYRRNATNGRGDIVFLNNETDDLSSIDYTNDSRMVIRNTGEVGIGVIAPSEALEVNGTVSATAFIGNGAGLTGLPSSPWTVNGSNINYPTGSVSIGNPLGINDAALEIGGADAAISLNAFQAAPTTNLTLFNNDLTNNNFSSISFTTQLSNSALSEMGKIAVINTNHTSGVQSGDMIFMTREPSNIIERMRITSDGNVGINATAPTNVFEVREGLNQDRVLTVNGRDVRLGDIDGGGAGAILFVDGDGAGSFQFTGGNVGIGTNSPTEQLVVGDDLGNFYSTYTATVVGNTANGGALVLGNAINTMGIDHGLAGSRITTPNNLVLATTGSDFTLLGGNGANDAQGKLEIIRNSGTATPHIRLFENGDDFARLSFGGTNNTDSWTIAGRISDTAGSDDLNFFHSVGGNIMTAQSDGNVGIGTTAPSELLQINGSNAVTDGTDGTGIQISNTTATTGATAGITFTTTGSATARGKTGVIHEDVGSNGIGKLHLAATTNTTTTYKVGVADSKLTVLNNGNVGVGTTNPDVQFEVFSSTSNALRISGTGGAFASGALEMNGTGALDWRVQPALGLLNFSRGDVEGGSMTDQYYMNDTFFVPATTGTKTLGSSSNRWSTVFATNGTINTSDRRLKKNIVPLKYGLNDLMKLETVIFNWKNEDTDIKDHLGLIAQDVQKFIPEVIDIADDKQHSLGLSYTELIPVTIKAIQEQQEIIDAQKAEIEELKAQIAKLFSSEASTQIQLDELKTQMNKLTAILTAEASNGKDE